MLETPIESAVCAYAKSKGWLVYKFVSPSNRGVPDRIFIKGGYVFFIEFKATGKTPTKLQAKRIKEFKHQGMDVYVIDDIQVGKALIDVRECMVL